MHTDAVLPGAHGHGRSHWLVMAPLVLLPFLLGGARPWFWSFVAALFFVGTVVSIWAEQGPFFGVGAWYRKGWFLLLSGIIAYPLLQVVPLPLSFLAVISPQRIAWIQRAGEITGGSSFTSVSYVPLLTLFSWLWWIFLGVYVLVLRRFFIEQRDLGRFFSVLFFFAGFEALYGLLQALIPKLGVLWEAGTSYSGLARGTFVNRNHFASFMGMVWPLLLAYSLSLTSQSEKKTASSFRETERDRQNRQKQLFLSFIIGMVLLSLFFSMSRGGILSSLVALTVFVILGGTKQKGTLSFVAISWMIMIGYGCVIGFDQIMIRFDKMENDAPGRLNIWQEAWQIIQDHPLMGAGLGSYPAIGSLYQVHLSDTLRTSHVHNDYLQLTTDLGVPVAVGMILLVWGYWWRIAWRVWQTTRGAKRKGASLNERQTRQHLLTVGALAGSAAFLCHAWVEFNWQIPANQLYFLMLLVLMHVGSKNTLGSGLEKQHFRQSDGS